jgi:hypothetical protein
MKDRFGRLFCALVGTPWSGCSCRIHVQSSGEFYCMSADTRDLISSREDAARFDTFAEAYANAQTGFALKHISLAAAYDFCQSREDGGRVFAAIFDVYVNFLLLFCDQMTATQARANAPASTLRPQVFVLDGSVDFDARMNLHRYNSSFVLRYRALWDKVMGLLILIYAPQQYECFIAAKSRKRKFRDISVQAKTLDSKLADSLLQLIEKFDNEFRTPEAHGTGSLRKWSFMIAEFSQDRSIHLLGYWNAINDVVSRLGKALSPPSAQK